MNRARALAFDGGLGTAGVIGAWLWRSHFGIEVDVDMADAFESSPSPKLMRTAQADDDVRRARELARWVQGHVMREKPDALAIEHLSLPQHAHAAKCCALAWGVFAAEIERWELPAVYAAPITCRRAMCRSGKEADAQAAALKAMPTALTALRLVKPNGQVHAMDALVVFGWSLTTDVMRGLARG